MYKILVLLLLPFTINATVIFKEFTSSSNRLSDLNAQFYFDFRDWEEMQKDPDVSVEQYRKYIGTRCAGLYDYLTEREKRNLRLTVSLENKLENETVINFDLKSIQETRDFFIPSDEYFLELYESACKLKIKIIESFNNKLNAKVDDNYIYDKYLNNFFSKFNNKSSIRFLGIYLYWFMLDSKNQDLKRFMTRICQILNLERKYEFVY